MRKFCRDHKAWTNTHIDLKPCLGIYRSSCESAHVIEITNHCRLRIISDKSLRFYRFKFKFRQDLKATNISRLCTNQHTPHRFYRFKRINEVLFEVTTFTNLNPSFQTARFFVILLAAGVHKLLNPLTVTDKPSCAPSFRFVSYEQPMFAKDKTHALYPSVHTYLIVVIDANVGEQRSLRSQALPNNPQICTAQLFLSNPEHTHVIDATAH